MGRLYLNERELQGLGLSEAMIATLRKLTEFVEAQEDIAEAQTDILELAEDIAGKIDKVASTDEALVRFDGEEGAVQNSVVTLSDVGTMDFTNAALVGTTAFIKFSEKTVEGFPSGLNKLSGGEFFNLVGGAVGSSLFSGGVDGESNRRIRITAGGSILLGSGSATTDTTIARPTAGGVYITGGNVGIGVTAPNSLLELGLSSSTGTYFEGGGTGSNAQLRKLLISASTTTNAGDTHTLNSESSSGVLVFATTGTERVRITGTGVTFAVDATVPDEAYGAGWNGSLEVPTKNALYDKIETLSGGASTTQTGEMIAGFIATPADKSYTLVLKMAHGGTITETTTKSASGTCTATFKVNSTALGGTANSVSSSEQSQAHASTNTFSAGDDIVLTVSSNSSCADMSFSIKYTRTLA